MPTDQTGRTPPWAKALGALLLAFLAVVLVSYWFASSREATRKDAAFEATRDDARRFADAVVAQGGTRPVDRQAVEGALASLAGRGNGLLFAVDPADASARVSIQFSGTYQRFLAVFGPSEAMVDRCFTVVFRDSGQGRQAQVIPHGSNESCTELARPGQ